MSIEPHNESTRGTRNHTGAVALFVQGVRPPLKNGPEIAEIGKSTNFFEEGRHLSEYEGGSIEHVPRESTPYAIAKALVEGLLLSRITIKGTPQGAYRSLDPGTYYLFVDFLEGEDDEEGRWIGRIVDTQGQIRCLCLGMRVKQIAFYNTDDRKRQELRKPSIKVHGIGSEDELLKLGPVSSPWYIECLDDVSPIGPDCFCVPEPI